MGGVCHLLLANTAPRDVEIRFPQASHLHHRAVPLPAGVALPECERGS